jgi:murein DD-endopeptidase MepM/ murein hydrolase activator NlpD
MKSIRNKSDFIFHFLHQPTVRWGLFGFLIAVLVFDFIEQKNPASNRIQNLSNEVASLKDQLQAIEAEQIENTKRELRLLPIELQTLYHSSKIMPELDVGTFVANSPLASPINGRFTSSFGKRRCPVSKTHKHHKGIDIAANLGTLVVAPGPGKVESVTLNTKKGAKSGHGRRIILDHGFGIKTLFAHLGQVLVKPGEKVTVGQSIGTVGRTGRSTGPHLHYEVIVNGQNVNPEKYITYQARRIKEFSLPPFKLVSQMEREQTP